MKKKKLASKSSLKRSKLLLQNLMKMETQKNSTFKSIRKREIKLPSSNSIRQ